MFAGLHFLPNFLYFRKSVVKKLRVYNKNRDNGCGRTRRVNWVYFSETWLKILNNLAWLKVGYNKITGLHFMSGRTEMGYEVG